MRTHELEIHRAPVNGGSLRARITHINPTRPVVKVRVDVEHADLALDVDMSWERYHDLRLVPEETVFVSARQMRVFVEAPAQA